LDALDPAVADHIFILSWDPDNPEHSWPEVVEDLSLSGVDVVIVDNLMGAMGPECDPSSAKDARALTHDLDRIYRAGFALIAVHHTPKDGPAGPSKSPLGSQHFRGWARSGILVTKTSEHQRKLTVENNLAAGAIIRWGLNYVDGAPMVTLIEDEAASAKKVVQRSPERLDRMAAAAAWIILNHRHEPRMTKLGELLEVEFSGSRKTWTKNLNEKQILGKLIGYDPEAGWQYRKPPEGATR
jgi:hypothetical protein